MVILITVFTFQELPVGSFPRRYQPLEGHFLRSDHKRPDQRRRHYHSIHFGLRTQNSGHPIRQEKDLRFLPR